MTFLRSIGIVIGAAILTFTALIQLTQINVDKSKPMKPPGSALIRVIEPYVPTPTGVDEQDKMIAWIRSTAPHRRP